MPEAFERELAVFSAARRLPTAERAAYLDRTCAGEPALRQRVEELLRAGEDAEGFLNEPAAGARRPEGASAATSPDAPGEKAGDQIGHYKLLQQIGEGGCGLVYMAEQEEPVRRRVALKVIKLGMDTKQVIARFEAERQALAMMDHPNIAKIYDAGATGGPLTPTLSPSDGEREKSAQLISPGRPYFVMELVRGIKITDYCDEHNLSTKERLELFVQVCHAVQHAHQKGIIHRDLKPSNILVASNDGVPVPKIIDFGIAKATQGRLADHTLFTAFEQFIGTPAYMSPEQAELTMQDVDTRTDIYSLGVLLYELLIGKTPFDAQELLASGLDAMRRTIREQEPARPSTKLSTMLADELTTTARHRRTEAAKLVHLLRGDLDWIVMKALEKDRTRRYETANGLAMDVRRYLADEPVVARPPSKLYRLQKLARRNRLAFAAAGTLTMALIFGFAISSVLLFREKEARRRAVAAEKLQRDLLQRAEVAERSAQAEASQLGEALFHLGDLDQAERFIEESLAMQTKLHGEENLEVAGTLNNLGLVHHRQGKLAEAERDFHRVLELKRKFFGDQSPELANCLFDLGAVLQYQGKLSEAEDRFREALTCVSWKPGDQTARENPNLGLVLHHLAEVLLERKAFAAARPLAEEATAMYERHPDWPPNERKHALRVRNAVLARSNDVAGSQEQLQYSQQPTWRVAAVTPPIKFFLAKGDVFARAAHWKEAAADYSRAIEMDPADHLLYFALAPLLVADDKREEYGRLRQEILTRFGWAVDPLVADKMSKACLILPPSGADLSVLAYLTGMAVRVGQSNRLIAYLQCTKGLSEYREGHFRSAVDWVHKGVGFGLRDEGHALDPYVRAQAYAVLAMAHRQLRQADECSVALAKGAQLIQELPSGTSGDIGNHWQDWIIAHVLTDEANAAGPVSGPGGARDENGPP